MNGTYYSSFVLYSLNVCKRPEASKLYDTDQLASELSLQITKEEVIQNLRRQSRGHQQNSSQYRGVTLHQKGKWEARIGTLIGRKYKFVTNFPSHSL